MAEQDNTEKPPAVQGALLEAQERRRPGRLKSVAPALIPLLRKPVPDRAEAAALIARDEAGEDAADDVGDESEDLAAVRGIAASLVLSVPLWALLFVAARFFSRS